MATDVTQDKYATLWRALADAYDQAARGKGKDRHAGDDAAFEDQPILTITRAVGVGFPFGQAIKKITEARGLLLREQQEVDAAKKELLGAINYLAAAYLYLDE